mgnify:CR=1 FL=1
MERQKLIIDTDCGSDDAMAIAMAMHDANYEVLFFSTVAGNVSCEQAVVNTLTTLEKAGTYEPPVYPGCKLPLVTPLYYAHETHGNDGMGDLGTLKEPTLKIEKMHAVDAIIKIVREGDGEIEIVALGTLTKVALAIVKAPEVMKKVPCITIMGGAAFEGNSNPLAEYNIWQDAEAADILFASGIPVVMAAIEACHDESEFSAQDLEYLRTCGSKLATFCVDINRGLIACDEAYFGKFFLDRAHRLTDQIVGVQRLGPGLVAQRRFGVGEQRDAGDVEFHGAFGIAHALIDAEAIHARHRGNRCAQIVAVNDEQRPDQVVGGQHVFTDQPARPF